MNIDVYILWSPIVLLILSALWVDTGGGGCLPPVIMN